MHLQIVVVKCYCVNNNHEVAMNNILKRMLGLEFSDYESNVLSRLNKSEVTSRKVGPRGGLSMVVSDVTRTEKFKKYRELASVIVSKSY